MQNISSQKQKLIDMVNNNHDLSSILIELRIYILLVMERDIPHVNIQLRQDLANNIIDYFIKGLQKNYFTNNNISNCLNRIIKSCSNFDVINNSAIYADCSELKIRFNFTNSFAISNMKHIIFHELTHSVANLRNQNLGEYLSKKNTTNDSLKIINRTDNFIPIVSSNMLTFLNELMAEATACELAETYNPLKTEVITNIFSDWLIHYNRSYQHLGYEFLKTLLYIDSLSEREVFKQFTINAINNNQSICSHILRVYEKKNPNTWKEDLHKITTILGDLTSTHILEENKVKEVRELMKKYFPQKKINIISRTDTDDTPRITIRK